MIDQFRKEHAFLSNLHPCAIRMRGVTYPSVENAFQAAKVLDLAARAPFVTMSPADAKKAGRKVPLRADWEAVKMDIMLEMLRMKFRFGSALAAQLLATGDLYLREGNYWNDTFWGYSLQRGVGENHLGKLLMVVRGELREKVAAKLRAEPDLDVPWAS